MAVLDAGVLIAFFERNDPFHHAARARIRGLRHAGHPRHVPAIAYAETLVRTLRLGRGDAPAVLDTAMGAMGWLFVAADRPVATAAASLRARLGNRLRLPDAFVLATAKVLGETVLTTDARWPDTGDITVEVLEA